MKLLAFVTTLLLGLFSRLLLVYLFLRSFRQSLFMGFDYFFYLFIDVDLVSGLMWNFSYVCRFEWNLWVSVTCLRFLLALSFLCVYDYNYYEIFRGFRFIQ